MSNSSFSAVSCKKEKLRFLKSAVCFLKFRLKSTDGIQKRLRFSYPKTLRIHSYSLVAERAFRLERNADTVMAVATDFHRTFLTPLTRISATDIFHCYFYCITEKLFVKTDRKTNESGGIDSPNFSSTERQKPHSRSFTLCARKQ